MRTLALATALTLTASTTAYAGVDYGFGLEPRPSEVDTHGFGDITIIDVVGETLMQVGVGSEGVVRVRDILGNLDIKPFDIIELEYTLLSGDVSNFGVSINIRDTETGSSFGLGNPISNWIPGVIDYDNERITIDLAEHIAFSPTLSSSVSNDDYISLISFRFPEFTDISIDNIKTYSPETSQDETPVSTPEITSLISLLLLPLVTLIKKL